MSIKNKSTILRNAGVIFRLIFCFPLGLYSMWNKTKWPVFAKLFVSALVVFVLITIFTPLTNPPERQIGGIVLVGSGPDYSVMGPDAPEGTLTGQTASPRRTSLLVEATPTPVPIMVYCNPGGRYYHLKECNSVGETTPQATLSSAVKAGYLKCPECNPPDSLLAN